MNTQAKHTPGPWKEQDRLDARGKPCGIDIVIQTSDAFAAYAGQAESWVVCRMPDGATVDGGHAWPEQRANARLIARAPEMADQIARLEAEKAELVELVAEMRDYFAMGLAAGILDPDADSIGDMHAQANALLKKHGKGE